MIKKVIKYLLKDTGYDKKTVLTMMKNGRVFKNRDNGLKGVYRMTIEEIKKITNLVAQKYPIKKITMFGSRASKTNRENSDVDFIVEFSQPVSLITISKLQIELEEALKLDVDIVHGPIQSYDMLEINQEVGIYAA